MWNRDQPEGASSAKTPSTPPRATGAKTGAKSEAKTGVASLGPSIAIKGTLTGDEDLLIEGRLEGEIVLHKQHVTIGRSGRVQADVYGSSICVEGEVKGNLFGEEQVVIRQSGKVRGNVTAPRVNLENGAKFKGAIDMQPGGKVASKGAGESVDDSPGAEQQSQQRPGGSKRAVAPPATRA